MKFNGRQDTKKVHLTLLSLPARHQTRNGSQITIMHGFPCIQVKPIDAFTLVRRIQLVLSQPANPSVVHFFAKTPSLSNPCIVMYQIPYLYYPYSFIYFLNNTTTQPPTVSKQTKECKTNFENASHTQFCFAYMHMKHTTDMSQTMCIN